MRAHIARVHYDPSMRIALVLLIALTACSKKKPATTPTPAAPAAGSAAEMQPGAPASAAPDTTPAPHKSSDPEEGGQ